jgi:hypothetical protein
MENTNRQPPCPRCGNPSALGGRYPSRWCGPKCKRAASKARRRRFERLHRVRAESWQAEGRAPPPTTTTATVALVHELEGREGISFMDAARVLLDVGAGLTKQAAHELLSELVDDGVLDDERIAGDDASRLRLAPRIRARRTLFEQRAKGERCRRQVQLQRQTLERGAQVAKGHPAAHGGDPLADGSKGDARKTPAGVEHGSGDVEHSEAEDGGRRTRSVTPSSAEGAAPSSMAPPALLPGEVASETNASTPSFSEKTSAPQRFAIQEPVTSPEKSPEPPRKRKGQTPESRTLNLPEQEQEPATSSTSAVYRISPPRPDGGTSFKLGRPPEGWSPELERVAKPFPPLGLGSAAHEPRRYSPEPRALHDADGKEVACIARHGRGYVCFHFEHHAKLFIYPTCAILEVESEGIWIDDMEVWLRRWLDRASHWLLGKRCPDVADARGLGWQTHKLELCADFIGLQFYQTDVNLFVNSRGGPQRVDSKGFKPDGQVETIEIGKRRHEVLAIETHNKTAAVLEKLKVDPAESFYAPTWRAYDWNGLDPIRRVEVRGRGRALRIKARKGSRAFDLTDPVSLLDQAALNAFWRHATTSRTRLVMPPPDQATAFRPRRAATDPRWVAVQDAGGVDDGVRFVRAPNDEARRLRWDQHVERVDRHLAVALARAAGLRGVPANVTALASSAQDHPDFQRWLAYADRLRESLVP